MIKNSLKALVKMLPVKAQIWINFRIRVGYFPNLGSPKTFNEKIQWRKLNADNPLFVTCSDKLSVRDFVREKVGGKYLIPVLFSGKKISVGQLRSLDGDYVVKTTHDSGGVFIVKSGSDNDFNFIAQGLEKSLLRDFGREVQETWYSKIEPMVLAEKMLQDSLGNSPQDFKFHVFRKGTERKIVLQVDYARYQSHSRSFYDEALTLLPYSLKYPNDLREIGEIENYKEMITLVEKLSEDFGYSRVDLYNVDGRIYFGEITFAAESGFGRFSSKQVDNELGEYWGVC